MFVSVLRICVWVIEHVLLESNRPNDNFFFFFPISFICEEFVVIHFVNFVWRSAFYFIQMRVSSSSSFKNRHYRNVSFGLEHDILMIWQCGKRKAGWKQSNEKYPSQRRARKRSTEKWFDFRSYVARFNIRARLKQELCASINNIDKKKIGFLSYVFFGRSLFCDNALISKTAFKKAINNRWGIFWFFPFFVSWRKSIFKFWIKTLINNRNWCNFLASFNFEMKLISISIYCNSIITFVERRDE